MKLLFIGDIVGRPGRALVRQGLQGLVRAYAADLVVANVENAAGGNGITREIGDELRAWGVDVMTSGNHVWDKKEALEYIGLEPRLLRPANYPVGVPGTGVAVVPSRRGVSVAVLNVMGRVFLANIDDPFTCARREAERLRDEGVRVILVDFHAETTSEKIAMGWYLDGLVTAVIGTHTHVQTADERVLPQGTAYLSDAGMTGPHDGVIGVDRAAVLHRFLTGLPVRFETASGDPRLHGAVVTADEATGRALAIERLSLDAEALAAVAAREAAAAQS